MHQLTLLQASAPMFSGMFVVLLLALVFAALVIVILRTLKKKAALSGVPASTGVSSRYPALKVLSGLFRIMGVLLILADLFLLGKVFTSGDASLYWLGAFGLTAFYALVSFAAAELMVLLSDVSVSASSIQSLLQNRKD